MCHTKMQSFRRGFLLFYRKYLKPIALLNMLFERYTLATFQRKNIKLNGIFFLLFMEIIRN
jgi:hypothetical protein